MSILGKCYSTTNYPCLFIVEWGYGKSQPRWPYIELIDDVKGSMDGLGVCYDGIRAMDMVLVGYVVG